MGEKSNTYCFKGDTDNIDNYRPIPLTHFDYKRIASVLTKRIIER